MAVRVWGEPWRFGWDPRQLWRWLAAYGFRLVTDADVDAAGKNLLPRRLADLSAQDGDRHIAVASPL